MKTPLVLLALTFSMALVLPASAGRHQSAYSSDSFQTEADLEANASKFWKASGLKKIAREDMQRLAIVEFNIEYLTTYVYDSNNQKGGLLGMGLKLGGVGKRHWELDDQFKLDLPERLYGEFVAMLEGGGFDVVPLEELRKADAFQRLRAEEDGSVGKKKSSTGGRGYSAKKSQKYEVHSVDGLLDLKDGMFSVMGNANAQAAMLHELGADGALRVSVRLGLDKKGRPVLMADSHLGIMAGVDVAEMPSGKRKPFAKHSGSVDAKKALAWSEDARGGKDFKGGKGQVIDIDEVEFEKALNEMYPAFMGMAISTLR